MSNEVELSRISSTLPKKAFRKVGDGKVHKASVGLSWIFSGTSSRLFQIFSFQCLRVNSEIERILMFWISSGEWIVYEAEWSFGLAKQQCWTENNMRWWTWPWLLNRLTRNVDCVTPLTFKTTQDQTFQMKIQEGHFRKDSYRSDGSHWPSSTLSQVFPDKSQKHKFTYALRKS